MTGKKHPHSQPTPDVTPPTAEQPESAAPAVDAQMVEALQRELDDARAKAAENFEGWQRERADFLNYKKRIERDQAQSVFSITGSLVKKYLVVLDDLERALKHAPTGGQDAQAWVSGVELVLRKFQSLLEAEGVQRIEAEGQQFDPNLHEAISHEDSPDHESGQVIEVLQQGYTLGDRVLRPALVRVAR